MLVEHHVVRCAVELLVGELRRLLGVNLDDGVPNGLPVLIRLVAGHIASTISGLILGHLKLDA